MKLKYIIIPTAIITSLLAASLCLAGWGDALKTAGDAGAKAAGLSYTPSDAVAGIKEVLSLGTDSAVSTLEKPGGFSSDSALAIPMPDMFSSMVDSTGLLSSFNKAAEASAPETGSIFMDAIKNLDISNPAALLGGGDDAITKFFESSSRESLKELVKPVVSSSLDAAGVGSYLNAMTAAQTAAGAIPFDAADYVTDYTLDGMFYLIAAQEKDIRSTGGGASELLKKLF